MSALLDKKTAELPSARPRRRIPTELGILLVLLGIGLAFEAFGWVLRDQSFLMNSQRLVLMILQVSIIGLLAIAVTQVIITTGIDLSSGSVLALSAMVAASLAQGSDFGRAVFPSLTDLPVWVPVMAGLGVGLLAGAINGSIIAVTGIPPFIATLGMMVSARGLARYYTEGQPISMLSDNYTAIGAGAMPVIIFLVVAVIFHIALRYTKYGKYTYAIGGNMQAARISGINVKKHLIIVYSIAGLLAGLAGVVASARAATGQAGMGMSYELDAIAAAVIGGTSLAGGVGRITGTVIGALILGTMASGFTFLGVDAYVQDIIKGLIIVVAVVIDQYRNKRKAKR
ncbi:MULTISPECIES: ABC transporter permease [Pseudomonas]|jgi:inositol transport system permease protein|uniref:ABC transporter n=3 Tax=Pseudomonas TaxID=286 RepID=A0A2Z5A5G7_9PSED|nr:MULTISPECIES: ABC transporter permease [Pseudomonas]AXA65146.1 ABC transporter [Pseudomonas oryzihabitans]MDH4766076.1 ABC transporter permease [Pseudomonas sp. CBMAI 2609]MDK8266392.1 ABC transporter permease [Pseudomonas oryzihabitans]MDR6176761.1 inositol transport system permease protein [Pseudomonas sp. SORGH_AS_0211]MDR6232240.1 inositol transport system permease protein [Pseudomonas sp. SORGH_AS_0199]